MAGKRRIRRATTAIGKTTSRIGGKIAESKLAKSRAGQGVSHGTRVLAGRQLTKKSMRKMDDSYVRGPGVPVKEKVGFLGRKRGFRSHQPGFSEEHDTYHVKGAVRIGRSRGKKSGHISVNKTFDREGRLAKKWTDANIVTKYGKKEKR